MDLHQISPLRGPEQFYPSVVADEAVQEFHLPWLGCALATGKRTPLSIPSSCHFSASAVERGDLLQVSLWEPIGPYRPGWPSVGKVGLMSTLVVARDPVEGDRLWQALVEQRGLSWCKPPAAPWYGALPRPGALARHPAAAQWLPDLQRHIARSWLLL